MLWPTGQSRAIFGMLSSAKSAMQLNYARKVMSVKVKLYKFISMHTLSCQQLINSRILVHAMLPNLDIASYFSSCEAS